MSKTLSKKYRDEMNSPAYQELDELFIGAKGWGDCSLDVTLDGSIEFECHIDALPYIAQELRDVLGEGDEQAVSIRIYADDRGRFLEYLRSIQYEEPETVPADEVIDRGNEEPDLVGALTVAIENPGVAVRI